VTAEIGVCSTSENLSRLLGQHEFLHLAGRSLWQVFVVAKQNVPWPFELGQPALAPFLQSCNSLSAYFSPSWTAFQADRGRYFNVIVDGVSN
jgi:hypothetical protein